MIYLKSNNLNSIKHGFFSRLGGVSTKIYRSLNCGYSSNDNKKNITENRLRILTTFNIKIDNFVVPDQCHSNKIELFRNGENSYKCDGIINTIPNIALGILTADCCPILVGHKNKKLTGVIHAGWKGVHQGIIENFLKKVTQLEFQKEDLLFALGPCIGKHSYEVTSSFKKEFLKKYLEAGKFFHPKKDKNYFNFNLRGCIISILKHNGVLDIWASRADTYKSHKKYFSYRYSVHKGYNDYGRMLSLILK